MNRYFWGLIPLLFFLSCISNSDNKPKQETCPDEEINQELYQIWNKEFSGTNIAMNAAKKTDFNGLVKSVCVTEHDFIDSNYLNKDNETCHKYFYNRQGKLDSDINQYNKITMDKIVYKYDTTGNLIEKKTLDAIDSNHTGKINYEYDNKNRMTKIISFPLNGKKIGEISFIYDSLGNKSEVRLFECTPTENLIIHAYYKYNSNGNLIKYWTKSDGYSHIDSENYFYDSLGFLSKCSLYKEDENDLKFIGTSFYKFNDSLKSYSKKEVDRQGKVVPEMLDVKTRRDSRRGFYRSPTDNYVYDKTGNWITMERCSLEGVLIRNTIRDIVYYK